MAHPYPSAILTIVTSVLACGRHDSEAVLAQRPAGAQRTEVSARIDRESVQTQDGSPIQRARTIRFSWKPVHASAREYRMDEEEDQHRILLSEGATPGRSYPVIVAFHGQPRRGQAPRTYTFFGEVEAVSRSMVASKTAPPHVLVMPTYRFEGTNWPAFDPQEFLNRVDQELKTQAISRGATYLWGHSGAAGCGGGGLNHVAAVDPPADAVGFFDTCIGPGLLGAVRELSRKGTPTLIMHSVETAGARPRRANEYDPGFDFGTVYAAMGLVPSACPLHLPEVPLRPQRYRCAANASGATRALIVDTGAGERAHNAIVKVALRYFLKEYLSKE